MRNVAFVTFCALATTAGAQTPPAPPPADARFATEIVVTPERGETLRALVPAATVVLDRVTLQTVPVAHPGEVAAHLPGFLALRPEFHAGGRPILAVRGFFGGGEAEYVLLLVNGVPNGDVESGLIDWSSVSLAGIERVEAARGPGASLYGDSAIGGVIQIFTNPTAGGGQALVTGGSFSTFSGEASYRRRLQSFGYTFSGAVRRTDGAFAHSAADEAIGRVALDGQGRRLSWQWSFDADDRGREDSGALPQSGSAIDPSASDPLHRFDRTDRRGFATGFTVSHEALFRPRARLHLRWRDDELIRTILLFPGFGDRRARDLSGLTIGGSIEGEHALTTARPLIIRFGLDLANDDVETLYRDVNDSGVIGAQSAGASGRRLRTGAFASSMIDVSPRVRITAGLRWDSVDDRDFSGLDSIADAQQAWSPRLGVAARVSEAHDVAVFAQVSRAFKAPTLDQRFDPRPYPDFQGGTFTISNPALTPQRAFNLEGGASGGGAVRWSALAYRMAVDDEIDFDVRTFSYANIGESVHTGLEVDLQGTWWARLRPTFSYAWSRVVAEGSDTQLKNVPQHVTRLGANGILPGAINAYVGFTHAAGAFIDDDGLMPLDGASTVDVRVSRTFGRADVFVDALNLNGDRYEQFGFTLADFTGAAVPYVYAGATRALRVGARVGF